MTGLTPQQAHRDYVSRALLFYEENGIVAGDEYQGEWEVAKGARNHHHGLKVRYV